MGGPKVNIFWGPSHWMSVVTGLELFIYSLPYLVLVVVHSNVASEVELIVELMSIGKLE